MILLEPMNFITHATEALRVLPAETSADGLPRGFSVLRKEKRDPRYNFFEFLFLPGTHLLFFLKMQCPLLLMSPDWAALSRQRLLRKCFSRKLCPKLLQYCARSVCVCMCVCVCVCVCVYVLLLSLLLALLSSSVFDCATCPCIIL